MSKLTMLKLLEQSAKTKINVKQFFFPGDRDIKQRLAEIDCKAEPETIKITKPDPAKGSDKSACYIAH
ncbi:hypothetical protein FEM48_Zijuj12G0047200 [Ziziphus jujuba var. spinosa]|uniref:Uncharacterized protein n=1 Tax=Ziziphus jujuba var. spinosa TaxID=714518 RepID=A0A978UB86_ZIZJJ|nr:hypothetical protein FEM48_Zijuj12G0047200 [Ziziphus jujuba var. spinosa]